MTQYVLCPAWVCTDPDELVLYNKFSGERQEISEETLKVLRGFAEPLSLQDFFVNFKIRSSQVQEVSDFLMQLVEVGLLEDSLTSKGTIRQISLGEALIQKPLRGMYSCPIRDVDTLGSADIVFIGSPFDLGVTGFPGAKFAPDKMRELSSEAFEYHASILTEKSVGWYSHEVNRNILDNVSMVDIGNVLHHVGESFDWYFDRVRTVVKTVLENDSFPVIIGGDHSVSYATITAFSDPEISILHIDAHTDLGTYIPEIPNNHGNVFSRLRAEGAFHDLTQMGVRSFAGDVPHSSSYRVISARQMRSGGYQESLDDLSRDRRYFLSLDIDVVDPAFAPGTGTPVTGGLNGQQLMELLSYLAHNFKIVGCDLVEVNPMIDVNDRTSLLANEVLLHLLGEVFK